MNISVNRASLTRSLPTSTTTALGQAVAAVAPELLDLKRQYRHLVSEAAKIDSRVANTDGQEDAIGRLRKIVADETELPLDILATFSTRALFNLAQQDLSDGLNRVAYELVEQQDRIYRDKLDDIFGHLDRQLQAAISKIPAAKAAVGGITTADEAIDQGKVDAWSQLAKARAVVADVRQGQQTLMATWRADQEGMITFSGEEWLAIGYASNLMQHWPDLPEYLRYQQRINELGNTKLLRPPWPNPQLPEFIDYCLKHTDIKPWVPTPDEAVATLNTIRRATTNERLSDTDLAKLHAGRKQMAGAR